MQAAVTAVAGETGLAVNKVIGELGAKLSSKAKVVTEEGDEWGELMQRWTDNEKENPGAIIVVATEDDIVETVKLCLENNVRFVPKAGGHSAWSTIGKDGIIIDLSAFNDVFIDKEASTATVQGGATNKDAITALFDAGLCCAFGSANTVGVVPQLLGGGLTALSGLLGFASDAILSARIITASGELVTVSNIENSELLYALKGAGQHFGLVTSVTLRAAPLSILGSEDGTLWSTTAFFPASRINELIPIFASLINAPNARAAGLVIITKDPMGSGTTIVLGLLFYLGTSEAANAHFASVKSLEPTVWDEKRVPYLNINDSIDPFCVKGGYKRFDLRGLPRFQDDIQVWEKQVELFDEIIAKTPSSGHSGMSFEWVGEGEAGRFEESAFGHRGVKTWIECLTWYEDKASEADVDNYRKEALKVATRGFKEEEVEIYQNFERDGRLEAMYPGKERLAKLKLLKRKWDPEGVFTKVFLE